MLLRFSTLLDHLLRIYFCFLEINSWICHLTFLFIGHSYLLLPCSSYCILSINLSSLSRVSLNCLSILSLFIFLWYPLGHCLCPLISIFSFPYPLCKFVVCYTLANSSLCIASVLCLFFVRWLSSNKNILLYYLMQTPSPPRGSCNLLV